MVKEVKVVKGVKEEVNISPSILEGVAVGRGSNMKG